MSKELDHLLKQTSEWLRGVGPASDIVMSSRIRLARNLEKLQYAARANDESQAEVLRIVREGAKKAVSLQQSLILNMSDLDEVDRLFLVERHLISRDHASFPDHRAVVIGHGEALSVMVNEEDHLRIQSLQS